MFHKSIIIALSCCVMSVFTVGEVRGDLTSWNEIVNGDNPLHWYKFDEASGSDCLDTGSGALPGTYDGVTLDEEGVFGAGTAVRFIGSGNNRVTFGSPAALSGDWTAEYIVKRMATGSQALHDDGTYSVRLEQWGGSGELGFTRYGVADYTFTAEPDQILITPVNKWTHLVFRKNGAGTQVFINGTLTGTSSDSIELPREQIGAQGAGSDALNAFLDEAVVYDRALSDSEIQSHYDAFICIRGDFNDSGVVDIYDLYILAGQWMNDCTGPVWCQGVDLNESEKVDLKDYAEFAAHWLEGYVAPTLAHIIPQPTSIVELPGTFGLQSGMSILVEQGEPNVAEVGQYLADMLNPATGYGFTVTPTTSAEAVPGAILLTTVGGNPDLGGEGYELIAEANSLLIRAALPAGLFYGVQSLRQLLPYQIESDTLVEGVEWSIPRVTIEDKPRFVWRGMHLDESRHFYGIDYVKKYIDYLAMYKMNTLHWHIDDDQGWRIEIPSYPLLTSVGAWRSGCSGETSPYGGFYTQAQIHEIVEYARQRQIKIVPEIEMPGHTQAVLEAYPQYSCTGGPFADACANWSGVQYDNVFCPSEDTFTFLENLLTEIMVLFPSEYIHIGGDEVNKQAWQESAVAQQVMIDNGLANENELQTWFISRVNDFLVANGKKPIGWSEIINGGIPNDAVVMSWLGMGAGITAVQAGHEAIMSPTSHCYFDYSYETTSTSKVYSFEPIPSGLTEQEEALVQGAQGNVWTEWLPSPASVDEKAIPRMTALAEVVWSPAELRDWDDFSSRLDLHYNRLDKMGVNYYLDWKVPGGPTLKEPATITTSLGTYDDCEIGYAFDGSLMSHFWSNGPPATDDYVLLILDTAQVYNTLEVLMATNTKPDDWLQNGVLEISDDGSNFTTVATITASEMTVDLSGSLVKAVRIRSTGSQVNWMILREIILE